MRILLAILLALCVFAPSAYAGNVPLSPNFFQGHEIGTQPGLYESYDEAYAYWAAVPGVKSLEDACGPPPQMFSVVNSPSFAGYGAPMEGDRPCMVWVEDAYMAMTNTLPDWMRDQYRCTLVVHEIGHTLGLEHLDYGDPSHIMSSNATTPAVCEAAYPRSEDTEEPMADPVLCVPGWAFYGPKRALRLYVAGHEAQALYAFKRWMRKRDDRRRVLRFAAVCQSAIYWHIPPGK